MSGHTSSCLCRPAQAESVPYPGTNPSDCKFWPHTLFNDNATYGIGPRSLVLASEANGTSGEKTSVYGSNGSKSFNTSCGLSTTVEVPTMDAESTHKRNTGRCLGMASYGIRSIGVKDEGISAAGWPLSLQLDPFSCQDITFEAAFCGIGSQFDTMASGLRFQDNLDDLEVMLEEGMDETDFGGMPSAFKEVASAKS
ncbi:MAG: hypothetical protein M1820_008730 [Bogoriella megaspora]|nr:MAG: hypothetical protein M1820_008730 [Bogoriella megaspora]